MSAPLNAEDKSTSGRGPGSGHWPLLLFAGALLLRLLHVWTIHDTALFRYLGLDPLAYDEWGQRIAAGDWLGSDIFYQDPLYPYFLGLLYAVLGHTYTGVVLVQSVLGALVAPLTHGAARHWLPRAESRVAGVLAAVYAPAIYYDGLVLKTSLGTFLVALALWLLSRALVRDGVATWLACGLSFGLGCLVRGNLLLFMPVLATWLLLRRDKDRDAHPARSLAAELGARMRRPRGWLQVGALALGVALVLGPTTIRNRVVGGEWVMTTAQAGPNFYLGNNPINQTGRYDPLPFVGANPKTERTGFTREAERRAGRALSPTAVSRFWFAESRRWLVSHPGDWVKLTWRKLRTYWGAYEVPDNLDYALYRDVAPVLRLPLPGFGLLAPLGLAGLWLARRRRDWLRPVSLFVVVYSSSVILFFVFSRYRMAMLPAVFPLAAMALMDGFRRARGARVSTAGRRRALALAALLVACLAFVNLPVHATAGSWSWRAAELLRLPRRLENQAAGHFNLALSYARHADDATDRETMLEMAVGAFREATRQDPGAQQIFAELGKALARLGRTEEAIEAYEQSSRLAPDRSGPHHVLGILYRRAGDPAAAERAFARALQLAPERVDSAVALGECRLARGDREGAVRAFNRALSNAPDDPAATDGLRRARERP